MRNFDKKDQAAVIAFVGVRLRNLTLDAMGKISFVEYADDIFEDIFGVKKLISKNVFAANRYDIYTNLERVGLDVLFELCNSGMYEIISDLVGITVRLDELDRHFKKMKRKGKKLSQRDEKEFKYLSKLYKESIKKLGKRFDTSVGKSYKQRYGAVSSFLEREHDYFGGDSFWTSGDDDYRFGNESIMSYLDDGYGSYSRSYDAYDDDFDYEDGDSPFEQFVSKSKSSRGKVKKSRRIEDEYDERPSRYGRRPMRYEDEYEDDYDERPRMSRGAKAPEDDDSCDAKELKGAIMKLANVVAHVAKEQKVIREVAENAYDAAAALYEDEEEEESGDFSATVTETLEKAAPQGVIKNAEIDDIINASM